MIKKLKNVKNNYYKSSKGISLVSLVVTIIVLIILSSIAIYLSLGNNGLFKRANQSAEETNKQMATEKINFKITATQIKSYEEKQEMATLQELADVLCEDDEIQYVTLKSEMASIIR